MTQNKIFLPRRHSKRNQEWKEQGKNWKEEETGVCIKRKTLEEAKLWKGRIVNFTSLLLYPKKQRYYPLNRKKNVLHSVSIRFVEDKNRLTPTGFRKPDFPARKLVAIGTALCRLSTAVNWYGFAFHKIG